MSRRGILCPYFSEDEREYTITVNAERYVEILHDFWAPELYYISGYIQGTWFQQHGATSCTFNTCLQRDREILTGQLFSRKSDTNWPPRTPDLISADFLLWRYLQSIVKVKNLSSLTQLRKNGHYEMPAITEFTCRAVMANFAVRLNYIVFKKYLNSWIRLFNT